MYATTAVEELSQGDELSKLYAMVIRDATEGTGFVINADGVLNRPVRFADTFNGLVAQRQSSPLLATLIGVIAATLFPWDPVVMSAREQDARNAFMSRYLPGSVQGVVTRTFIGVRTDLMPRIINMKPVLEKSGAPCFLPSADPYVCLAQCDLALEYHMHYGLRATDDVKAMYRFAHLMLREGPQGEPARIFSPQVLGRFVENHVLEFLIGEGKRTPLMAPTTHVDLAYRLYVEGVLDSHFGKALAEKQFCEKVARCTVREPGKSSIPILQPATPITMSARDRRVFGDTRVADPYFAAASLED